MAENAPQTSTRGTDRVRRRRAQADAVVKADKEAASLASPGGPEKDAAIAANKAAEKEKVARFASEGTTRRKAAQAANRTKADKEAATLPEAPAETPLVRLKPGQQADLVTANHLARIHDEEARDYERAAANAAGLAVHETLRGRPLRGKHNRSR